MVLKLRILALALPCLLFFSLTPISILSQSKPCPIHNGHSIVSGSVWSKPSKNTATNCLNNSSSLWTNISELQISDDHYTEISMESNAYSQCLVLQNFNLQIPKGATVHGISLEIEGHSFGGYVRSNIIEALDTNAVATGDNKATYTKVNEWPRTNLFADQTWVYGGQNEKWGLNPNPQIVNHPNFGFRIRLQNISGTSAIAKIDRIRLHVYYTPLSTMCMHDCVNFWVDPVPGAEKYHWTFPPNCYIVGGDPASDAITLNISGLFPGVHEVCAQTESNGKLSQACCLQFLIENCARGSIGDQVFYDENGNNLQDLSDKSAKKIKVHLFQSLTKKLLHSTETDSLGKYQFDSLETGYYYLKFDLPTPFVSAKAYEGNNGSLDYNIDHSNGINTTDNIFISPGQNRRDIDAAMYTLTTIGDFVWEDINANGLQDNLEVGLSNIKLYLFSTSRKLLDSTLSQQNGKYEFKNIPPGNYFIRADFSNFGISPQNPSTNFSVDNDFNSIGETNYFTVNQGNPRLDIDLGLFRYSSFSGLVWFDLNKNGIQENTEKKIPGIKINLMDVSGNLIQSKISGPNGEYEFKSLVPGREYKLCADLSTEWNITVPDLNSNNFESIDNDFSLTACTENYITANNVHFILDLGLYSDCEAIAPDMAILAMSELCYSGKEINIIFTSLGTSTVPNLFEMHYVLVDDLTGMIIDYSTSPNFKINSTGQFSVFALILGSKSHPYYYVDINQIPKNSIQWKGLLSSLNEQGFCFSKSSQGAQFSIDACSSISGVVWFDLNQNGVQEVTEKKISGIKLYLLDAQGQRIESKLSSSTGQYSFTGITPGAKYSVECELTQEWLITKQDIVNNLLDQTDSDFDKLGKSDQFLLQTNQQLALDLGLHWDCKVQAADMKISTQSESCFSGQDILIQFAEEGNHQLEPYYEVKYVLIDAKADTILAYSSQPEFNITTIGDYALYAIVSGNISHPYYHIDFSQITIRETKWTKLIKDWKDQGYCLSISNKPARFTINPCTGITGTAWYDYGQDGIQDTEDRPMPNLVVQLLDDQKNVLDEKQTNTSGQYQFINLNPGLSYYINFKFEQEYGVTLQDASGFDFNDSDIYPNGISNIISFSNLNYATIDGGFFFHCTSNAGTIKAVSNLQDCISSSAMKIEAAVSQVQVPKNYQISYLLLKGRNQIIEDFSNNPYFEINHDGSYYIAALIHNPNLNDYNYVDLDLITKGSTKLVEFSSYLVSKRICHKISSKPVNFLAYHCVSVGGKVWYDRRKNNINDQDEQAIEQYKISLLNSSGAVIDEKWTNKNGEYFFDQLSAVFDYKIKAESKPGYQFVLFNIGGNTNKDSDVDAWGESQNLVIIPGQTERVDIGVFMPCSIPSSKLEVESQTETCYMNKAVTVNLRQNQILSQEQEILYLLSDKSNNAILESKIGMANNSFTLNTSGLYQLTKLVYVKKADHPEYLDVQNILSSTNNLSEFLEAVYLNGACTLVESTDFELPNCFTIHGYVWLDKDKNGMQDEQETKVGQVKVYLLDEELNKVDETTTNNFGKYEFDVTNRNYIVRFVPDAEMDFTKHEDYLTKYNSDVTNRYLHGTTDMVSITEENRTEALDAGLVYSASLALNEIQLSCKSYSNQRVLSWTNEITAPDGEFRLLKQCGEQWEILTTVQNLQKSEPEYIDKENIENSCYYKVEYFNGIDQITSNIVYSLGKPIQEWPMSNYNDHELKINRPAKMKQYQLNIYSVSGSTLYRNVIDQNEFKLNVENWPSGIVILEYNVNNNLYFEKIILR
ncbi:MAG TPA: SdrD B-like domain-containing protein [Saprospiraceae bacterium]|nr:SdrD B-like domain-containing protein [Saprospiraceae bacterium]